MKIDVHHRTESGDGFRTNKVQGLFNVDAVKGERFDLEVELPIEEPGWQIGLVVGPSGSGKSSIGRALAFDGWTMWENRTWNDEPIVENIAPDGTFDEVTTALAAVGLGTVPSWLRPYHVLSNGEKFRADLARVIAEQPPRVIIDEFTSVVDRQIATIGAMAFAKSWRRTKGQAVLLTCHHDVEAWVQPDWVFDTGTGELHYGARDARPKVTVEIRQTSWQYWKSDFEEHHYLAAPPMPYGTAYVAFVNGEPVAHLGMTTMWAGQRVAARACRMVVMPEWQGAGIGLRFLNLMAQREFDGIGWAKRPANTYFHTAHPGLVAALKRDRRWKQVSAKVFGGKAATIGKGSMKYGGHWRGVAGFMYIGPQED